MAEPTKETESKQKNIIIDKVPTTKEKDKSDLQGMGNTLAGAARTPGMPGVDFKPIDDHTDAVGKSNTLYYKVLEMATNVNGAFSPDDIKKIKESIPNGLMMKVSDLPIPEIEKIKYEKSQAMARVAVMSTLAGMFQTGRGSSGNISTAGAEAFSAGINAVQNRADVVAATNQAIDEKNANFLKDRYDSELDFAKAYNTAYNTFEKQRNTAANNYMKHKVDLYKETLKTLATYGASALTTAGKEQDSQRDYEADKQKEIGVRAKAAGDFIIRSDKNKIEMVKAALLVRKAGNDLEKQGVMSANDYVDSIAAMEANGLSPVFGAALAGPGITMPDPKYNPLVNAQTDLIVRGLDQSAKVDRWFDNEEQSAQFLYSMVPLLMTGQKFTEASMNDLVSKARSGEALQTKTSIFTGDLVMDANRYPETAELFKKGKILQTTKTDGYKQWQNNAQQLTVAYQMYDEAKRRGDNKLANKIEVKLKEATGFHNVIGQRYKDVNGRDMTREDAIKIGNGIFARLGMVYKNKINSLPGFEIEPREPTVYAPRQKDD